MYVFFSTVKPTVIDVDIYVNSIGPVSSINMVRNYFIICSDGLVCFLLLTFSMWISFWNLSCRCKSHHWLLKYAALISSLDITKGQKKIHEAELVMVAERCCSINKCPSPQFIFSIHGIIIHRFSNEIVCNYVVLSCIRAHRGEQMSMKRMKGRAPPGTECQ